MLKFGLVDELDGSDWDSFLAYLRLKALLLLVVVDELGFQMFDLKLLESGWILYLLNMSKVECIF
jgi:hypothetical protein